VLHTFENLDNAKILD